MCPKCSVNLETAIINQLLKSGFITKEQSELAKKTILEKHGRIVGEQPQ